MLSKLIPNKSYCFWAEINGDMLKWKPFSTESKQEVIQKVLAILINTRLVAENKEKKSNLITGQDSKFYFLFVQFLNNQTWWNFFFYRY